VHHPVERLRPTPPGVAYAGLPFEGAPSARSNTAAIAGAALSVVPILGMIVSILGLTRAQTLGGAGRTVATVGLVLSVVFTAGEAFAVYELGGSAPADPACVATQTDVDALQGRLSGDAAALAKDQASGDKAASTAAASALVIDLRSVKSALERNVGQATHANVRAGIQTFDGDLGTLISSVRQVESGDQAAMSQLQATVGKLRADGQSVDVLCGTGATHG
jgi:hypothetical protein